MVVGNDCVTELGSELIRKLSHVISLIIGVVFKFAMVNVYYIDTVPAWNSLDTVTEFVFYGSDARSDVSCYLITLSDSPYERRTLL
ncbi:dimethyl sulfoxide reductase anchor subunit [Vibrio sp. AK197]